MELCLDSTLKKDLDRKNRQGQLTSLINTIKIMQHEDLNHTVVSIIEYILFEFYSINIDKLIHIILGSNIENTNISLILDSNPEYLSLLSDMIYVLTFSGFWASAITKLQSRTLLDYLILNPNSRNEYRHTSFCNLIYSITPINELILEFNKINEKNTEQGRFVNLKPKFPALKTESSKTYNPINPSILICPDGNLIVLVRGVNFTSDQGINYRSLDNDRIVRTCNMVTYMDKDFNILEQKILYDNIDRKRHHTWVQGLEDCRLFYGKNNKIYFTATSLETDSSNCARLVICKTDIDPELDNCRDKISFRATSLMQIVPPDINRTEKNWLPFYLENFGDFRDIREEKNVEEKNVEEKNIEEKIVEEKIVEGKIVEEKNVEEKIVEEKIVEEKIVRDIREEKVLAFYGYNPLTIREIDPHTGKNTEKIIKVSNYNFGTFRGSGGPVKFNYKNTEGYLIIVHEVIFGDKGKRTYIHRWVWLDINFEIKAISDCFFFLKLGIEFCSSLCLSKNNDINNGELIVGFGANDENAYLYIVKEDTVRNILKQLPNI